MTPGWDAIHQGGLVEPARHRSRDGSMGDTSRLDDQELDDLVAFLRTL